MNWTEKQKKVIDTRGRNILVAAAAGSGKTAVLVERIIQMITDSENPVDIDELLVVTFTRAAASEMKERVRERLDELAEQFPENDNIRKQLSLIHSAQITTIDSFCTRVVKEHFEQIDMDPNYRIGDEVELEMMQSDIIQELLEERYEEAEPEFMNLAQQYTTSKMKDEIGGLIKELYYSAIGQYNPEEWLQNCSKIYEIQSVEELEETQLYKDFIAHYRKILAEFKSRLEEAASRMYQCNASSTAEALEKVADVVGLAASKEHYMDIRKALEDIRKSVTVKFPADFNPDLKTQIGGLKTMIVKYCKFELLDKAFKQNIKEIVEEIKMSSGSVKMIQNLTEDFMIRFREKKLEKGIIDFTDQAHLALRILNDRDEEGNLHPSEVAKNMAKQFYEIMIDEYQDSNYIQEAILSAVANGRGVNNMFMVGDVKQSIYKFRQAEPKLFLSKFDTYSEDCTQDSCRIILDKNFRSRREIIDSVNYLFDYLMHKELGGIDYKNENRLTLGSVDYDEVPEGQNQNTEFIILETKEAENEPAFVAQKIREITNPKSGRKITKKKGEMRPVEYRDIAILLRTVKNVSESYQEQLEALGIPSYAEKKTGFYDTIEVRAMIDFLTVINNPYQDIPLVGTLCSPMFGFSEEELAKIKMESHRKNFYESVEYYFLDGTDEKLKAKVEQFLTTLKRFRDMVPYTTVYELIQEILRVTGYDLYIQAMPNGRRRQMNLEALKEKAVNYDATSYKGLFNFTRYIERIKKVSGDEGEMSTVGEQDNLVRIMTIHKSKGLQFPVVFLCETSAGSGKDRDKILVDDDGNIGVDCIDPVLRTKEETFYKRWIKERQKEEDVAEKMRILYVAMTRAQEKLFITGRCANASKTIGDYAGLRYYRNSVMPYTDVLLKNSFFDWMGNTLGKNKAFEDVRPEMEILQEEEMELRKENEDYEKDSCYSLSVVEEEDIFRHLFEDQVKDQMEKEEFRLLLKDAASQADPQKLKEMLEFEYPYKDYISMYSKASVSEIKKQSMAYEEMQDGTALFGEKPEPELEEIIPDFEKQQDAETGLTGAKRGTAYHRVFELLDMSVEEYTSEMVEQFIEEYVEKGLLSKEEADCINCADIVKFTDTELFRRMKQAAQRGELYRERKFLMGVPAASLAGKEHLAPTEDMVVIQGIIDVCFLENGKFVLADYKTDKVKTLQQLVDKYHVQLESYQKALEQIAGIEVSEMIIYSVTLGDEIKIEEVSNDYSGKN